MFNKIKGLFKKQNNKENKNDIIERKKREKEQLLQRVRESILTKSCPFKQGSCDTKCVHFEDGEVYVFPELRSSDGTGRRVHLKTPRCKLWNQ